MGEEHHLSDEMELEDQQIDDQRTVGVVEVIQGQTAGSDAGIISRVESGAHDALQLLHLMRNGFANGQMQY